MDPLRRAKGESAKAFAAYADYRDSGGDRSLRSTAERVGKHHSLIERWSRRHQWVHRVGVYDADVAEQARLARAKAIEEMNERQAAIATAVQGKVIARLNGIDANTLSPGQLILWLEKATTIERRARGEATEVIKHDGAVPVELANLTEEELAARAEGILKQLRSTRE